MLLHQAFHFISQGKVAALISMMFAENHDVFEFVKVTYKILLVSFIDTM